MAVAARADEKRERSAFVLCFCAAMPINVVTHARTEFTFDLAEAERHLSARDEQLRQLIAEAARFEIDVAEAQSPYEALMEAITYQSISGKAAATIYARVKSLGTDGRPPSPEEMLKMPARQLRKAGLSAAKVLAMKDLAQKTVEGIVPTLEEALTMSDQELVERLDSVRGIGAWTVEMFLIFRLGRPDVLPIHDLGVQKGWCVTYGKKHMPTPKELLAFGERWRPYRTIASWYMWRAFERAGYTVTNKILPPRGLRKAKAIKIAVKKKLTTKKVVTEIILQNSRASNKKTKRSTSART